MFRVPISPSPVVNAIRRSNRILVAVKDASHVCGLPVRQGATIFVELKTPSAEPMLPMNLLFPLVNEQEEPDLSQEHILSIYCDGRPSRIVVPLSRVRDMSAIQEAELDERLNGKTPAPGSPLAEICAYRSRRKVKRGACYLTVFYTPDGAAQEFFVLACPRRPKESRGLIDYFCELERGGADTQPAWTDLGLPE